MIHATSDPVLEFTAREADREERRSVLLSRADGRRIDGLGFSTGVGRPPGGTGAAQRRAKNREARKRRLQIARWWAQAKREWEAEIAECRRRACDEFAVPPSVAAAGNRELEPPAAGLHRLLVTAVDLRPVSERGEAKNGVELTFEVEAGRRLEATTVDRPASRSFKETFGWPSRLQSDGGAFAGKRLARLGLATGVIGPDSLGRSVPVAWPEMVGRRLVAAVRYDTFAVEEGEIVLPRVDELKMWPASEETAFRLWQPF
ncbi:MAG TPA: hypothetical protein VG125_33810 [Pirellulales bacterium]|jgi:hypothetical protein|nr:hypothetical protein [Pirellulales bacterium]